MESLYFLVPFSLLVIVLVAALLFRAIRDGQFDDMEGPAHSILMDNDTDTHKKQNDETKKLDADQNI
jgi:cbb3-type cytochrome oxidase maturation protein